MAAIFHQSAKFTKHTAIICKDKKVSYGQLYASSEAFAKNLLNDQADLNEARVAFMVDPGADYVKVLWGIWMAGGIAVPLCLSHPLPALQYVLEDTSASTIIVSPSYEALLSGYCNQHNIKLKVVKEDYTAGTISLPAIDDTRRALILYTSGTTNKPKGVVSTHKNLEAQVTTLVSAWQWNDNDHTLCVLPLHHVHGIVNVVCCSLYAGATCEFLPEFSAVKILGLFESGNINVFMAVPTVYFKLITAWEGFDVERKKLLFNTMSKFRLMVSGSAALPVSIMDKWKGISDHKLLERYGMTEIGMAISNPYTGMRRAGYVGLPLPGVSIKLADENYMEVSPEQPGEILVKGDNVFLEYWQQPEATKQAFTMDGWFKTGDIAVVENHYYRIMDRSSVDIIKSGGYKISALEIEEVLREFPGIADCAVVGLPDEEWGELIVAAIVSSNGTIDENTLTDFLKSRIASYKLPRKYFMVDELPRNAMGKVTKNDVKKLFV